MPSSATPPLALLPLRAKAVAVIGLLWRPLPPQNAKSAAHRLLQSTAGERLVLHYRDNQAQCGIAPPLPAGQRYHSAALLLMAQLGDDWIGIFEWENGQYLLCGVAGGQIVPGCDGLFESAAAVTAQFERFQALCDWSTRYAPEQLNLGGEPLDISTLLHSSTPLAYQLKVVYNTPKNRQRWLRGSGVVLLLLILAYTGQHYFEQQQAALSRLTQQQLSQLQAQRQQKKMVIEEAVWQQQPAARVVLQQCTQHLSHYPLLLGGWQLVAGQCGSQGSSATYQRRDPSHAKLFLQAAAERYPHHRLQDTERAQIQQPLRLEARLPEQLQPLPTLSQAFKNPIERGAATGSIDDSVTATKKSANFRLSCHDSPLQLLQKVELSGVVIHHLNNTISQNGLVTWSLQGTLYGE